MNKATGYVFIYFIRILILKNPKKTSHIFLSLDKFGERHTIQTVYTGHLKWSDNCEIQEEASYSYAFWVVSLVTIITYCFNRIEDWENILQIVSHKQRLFLIVLTAFHSHTRGFPGDTAVKNLPANAEDAGLIPGWGSPWRKKWQPTPVFLLENPMDRRAWRAIVLGVPKSWTWLSDWNVSRDTFFFSNSSSSIDLYLVKLPPAFSWNLYFSQKSEKYAIRSTPNIATLSSLLPWGASWPHACFRWFSLSIVFECFGKSPSCAVTVFHSRFTPAPPFTPLDGWFLVLPYKTAQQISTPLTFLGPLLASPTPPSP